MIGIIDYGAGNLRSVKKALDYLGAANKIIRQPKDFAKIQKLLLPGVGAFGAAVQQLTQQNLFDPLREWLLNDKPFLGICLGMQVLFESSEEAPGVSGLGIFPGTVLRFQHHKVPQIGWNQILFDHPTPLLSSIPTETFFYFLHGYYVSPQLPEIIIAQTEYSVRYPSIIQDGNVIGVQFHPEKSARMGLTLLQNWVQL